MDRTLFVLALMAFAIPARVRRRLLQEKSPVLQETGCRRNDPGTSRDHC